MDIHSKLYEEALQVMHDAALLKGKHWESTAGFMADALNRKNASIFANNPKVGLANFVDPAPMTLVHFGRHWLRASATIRRKEIRQAINKLPVVPQADLSAVEIQQSRMNRGAPMNFFQRLRHVNEDVNDIIGNKLALPFFRKERLTGLADKMYTRTAVVASIYKQAHKLGMDGNQLLDAVLLNKGKIDPGLRAHIWKNVSADLSQLFNTLNPHLNRDLFADSLVGKVTAAYSRPQRRVGRYMYNLMIGSPKDKVKFTLASMMYLGLGGRAMLPTSVRNMMIYAGALGMGFQTKDAINAFQNLDNANLLKATTGWDLSDRISYDMINIAAPFLQDVQGIADEIASIKPGETPQGKAARVAARVITAFALFPKVAGFGTGYLNSIVRNAQYAAQGYRPLYVQVGPATRKVPIPYDAADALRDSILAGPNPKQQAAKPEIEKQLAGRLDQKRDMLMNRGNQAPAVVPGFTSTPRGI
jgi:hypothetical protein